jgi:hypothetical protein
MEGGAPRSVVTSNTAWEERRPNLTILTDAWVSRINMEGDRVTGVNLTLQSGNKLTLKAKKETILCAGAVDTLVSCFSRPGSEAATPRPWNSLIMTYPVWARTCSTIRKHHYLGAEQASPAKSNHHGLRCRHLPPTRGSQCTRGDGEIADIMMHCYQIPFCLNTARLGMIRQSMRFA